MNTITPTADNSNTLFNEAIGEHYHSKHGALQESRHVFIDAGLKFALNEGSEITVMEVGFGTGLNFILTLDHCLKNNIKLKYTALEAFPLDKGLLGSLDYESFVDKSAWDAFINGYEPALDHKVNLTADCSLHIIPVKLQVFEPAEQFELVYYDAFSVRHQPEMWTDEIIAKTCNFIKPGGTFVTYAITGALKRAVKAAGFTIEKLPGAPGKREMLRAVKSN